jgi:hypothetical protein
MVSREKRDQRIRVVLRIIRAHCESLTCQQIKTLRGQALSGNVDGAMKGLARILSRKE